MCLHSSTLWSPKIRCAGTEKNGLGNGPAEWEPLGSASVTWVFAVFLSCSGGVAGSDEYVSCLLDKGATQQW